MYLIEHVTNDNCRTLKSVATYREACSLDICKFLIGSPGAALHMSARFH